MCGESIASPLPGFSGTVSHSGAALHCAGVSARLCTLDELIADETAGTGCGYDLQYTWSSSPCGEASYWASAGASQTTWWALEEGS